MIRYALLGLLQGVTEFFPISSSGHLVLAEQWLQIDPPGVLLEAMLHWGSVLAIVWVFRRDLRALLGSLRGRGELQRRKEVGFLLAGTVPVVAVALLLRNTIESAFSSALAVGVGLLVTAVLLAVGHVAKSRARRPDLRFVDAMAVGIAQAGSLFPGVSRSGATLSAASVMGLNPIQAARLSFLLALPALFGAGLLHLWDGLGTPEIHDWLGILLGAACAFGSGLITLRAVLALLQRRRLGWFALYCLVLGTGTLVWLALS